MSSSLRDRVAAEIRAEMARQRKTGIELAACLDVSQQSASRRLAAETNFDLDELEKVVSWLGIPVGELMERTRAASAVIAS